MVDFHRDAAPGRELLFRGLEHADKPEAGIEEGIKQLDEWNVLGVGAAADAVAEAVPRPRAGPFQSDRLSRMETL